MLGVGARHVGQHWQRRFATARCWPLSQRGGSQLSWISPSTSGRGGCSRRHYGDGSTSGTGLRPDWSCADGSMVAAEYYLAFFGEEKQRLDSSLGWVISASLFRNKVVTHRPHTLCSRPCEITLSRASEGRSVAPQLRSSGRLLRNSPRHANWVSWAGCVAGGGLCESVQRIHGRLRVARQHDQGQQRAASPLRTMARSSQRML